METRLRRNQGEEYKQAIEERDSIDQTKRRKRDVSQVLTSLRRLDDFHADSGARSLSRCVAFSRNRRSEASERRGMERGGMEKMRGLFSEILALLLIYEMRYHALYFFETFSKNLPRLHSRASESGSLDDSTNVSRTTIRPVQRGKRRRIRT